MSDDVGMDLATFLLARITEDESNARQAVELDHLEDDPDVAVHYEWARFTVNSRTKTELSQRLYRLQAPSPARVLAECEAKRRIIDMFTWKPDTEELWDDGREPIGSEAMQARREALRGALVWLALTYTDHPDYRQEWAP